MKQSELGRSINAKTPFPKQMVILPNPYYYPEMYFRPVTLYLFIKRHFKDQKTPSNGIARKKNQVVSSGDCATNLK